jgi:hypothetical protein
MQKVMMPEVNTDPRIRKWLWSVLKCYNGIWLEVKRKVMEQPA